MVSVSNNALLYPIAAGFATENPAGIAPFPGCGCVKNVQKGQNGENNFRILEFNGCQFAYHILK